MYKRLLISTLVMTIASCDRVANLSDKSATDSTNAAQHINDLGAFTAQANTLISKATGLLQNPAAEESDYIALIQEFESLNKAGASLNASKDQLLEPELLSTLGSLYSKRASFYAKEPTKAGAFAAKGIRYLDKAVDSYPDNITARLNRGIVFMHMPEFLNKTEPARQDFEYIRSSPKYASLSDSTRTMVENLLNEANLRISKTNITVTN